MCARSPCMTQYGQPAPAALGHRCFCLWEGDAALVGGCSRSCADPCSALDLPTRRSPPRCQAPAPWWGGMLHLGPCTLQPDWALSGLNGYVQVSPPCHTQSSFITADAQMEAPEASQVSVVVLTQEIFTLASSHCFCCARGVVGRAPELLTGGKLSQPATRSQPHSQAGTSPAPRRGEFGCGPEEEPQQLPTSGPGGVKKWSVSRWGRLQLWSVCHPQQHLLANGSRRCQQGGSTGRAVRPGSCLSQNPSTAGVGRALCGSPSPTPCRSRVTQSRLHSTASRRVLNISREGDSTTSLNACISHPILPFPPSCILSISITLSPGLLRANHWGCEPREGMKAGIQRKLCLRNPLRPVRENNPPARK